MIIIRNHNRCFSQDYLKIGSTKIKKTLVRNSNPLNYHIPKNRIFYKNIKHNVFLYNIYRSHTIELRKSTKLKGNGFQ